MKSAGTPILSASSKKSFQDSGRCDRITSPLSGSRRMYTSEPSKRYSAGSRTAWLRPFRNTLAVRGMVYIVVYITPFCQGVVPSRQPRTRPTCSNPQQKQRLAPQSKIFVDRHIYL